MANRLPGAGTCVVGRAPDNAGGVAGAWTGEGRLSETLCCVGTGAIGAAMVLVVDSSGRDEAEAASWLPLDELEVVATGPTGAGASGVSTAMT